MLSELEAWLNAIIPASYGFTFVVGEWVEPTNGDDIRYCAITQEGGRDVDVDDRRPNYRVVLIGRRNQRGDARELAAAAEILMKATIDPALLPCGAANIRAMGEPVGPGVTAEQRAWFSLNLQLLL